MRSIKAAVRTQNMQVRMPSQEIAKRMYDNDGPWNRVLLRNHFPEKFLQDLPGKAGGFRKQFSVVKEIPTEDLRYAEDKMPVGYGLEDLLTKPLAKFHHPFLVAGWTEEWQDQTGAGMCVL